MGEPTKDILQQSIEHEYRRFIGMVAKSRKQDVAAIDAIAQGRVWSGVGCEAARPRRPARRLRRTPCELAAKLARLGKDYDVEYFDVEVGFGEALGLRVQAAIAQLLAPLVPQSMWPQLLPRGLQPVVAELDRVGAPQRPAQHLHVLPRLLAGLIAVDPVLLLKAAILGVVEGLTEFLPVSSTGHLILAATLLDFHDARGKLFEIVIQSGAILAVVWEFRAQDRHGAGERRRVIRSPAACCSTSRSRSYRSRRSAWCSARRSRHSLFNAPTVAAAFILGGLVILWAERRTHTVRIHSVDEMTPLDALKVGIAQAFALIPGTSRSGATIIGGMLFGLSRQVATEFTFYLAIPTLGIASLYSLYKERELLALDDLGIWVVGMVAAFVSAFACVRWLIRYVATHTFVPFAWYRIAFGVLVLFTAWSGLIHWSA